MDGESNAKELGEVSKHKMCVLNWYEYIQIIVLRIGWLECERRSVDLGYYGFYRVNLFSLRVIAFPDASNNISSTNIITVD